MPITISAEHEAELRLLRQIIDDWLTARCDFVDGGLPPFYDIAPAPTVNALYLRHRLAAFGLEPAHAEGPEVLLRYAQRYYIHATGNYYGKLPKTETIQRLEQAVKDAAAWAYDLPRCTTSGCYDMCRTCAVVVTASEFAPSDISEYYNWEELQ